MSPSKSSETAFEVFGCHAILTCDSRQGNRAKQGHVEHTRSLQAPRIVCALLPLCAGVTHLREWSVSQRLLTISATHELLPQPNASADSDRITRLVLLHHLQTPPLLSPPPISEDAPATCS